MIIITITTMILIIIMSVRMIRIIAMKITSFKLRCNANANFGQGQFIKMLIKRQRLLTGLSAFNMGFNYD